MNDPEFALCDSRPSHCVGCEIKMDVEYDSRHAIHDPIAIRFATCDLRPSRRRRGRGVATYDSQGTIRAPAPESQRRRSGS